MFDTAHHQFELASGVGHFACPTLGCGKVWLRDGPKPANWVKWDDGPTWYYCCRNAFRFRESNVLSPVPEV